MSLAEVSAVLEQAFRRSGDARQQKLHEALEKIYEVVDSGADPQDLQTNKPIIEHFVRDQLTSELLREDSVLLQRIQSAFRSVKPRAKSFTLKSLSKGTTTGQFKTVKDATEAAQFANETKADGTDDWIPEEKGFLDWLDGHTPTLPIANSIRDTVRSTIPQFRKLMDLVPRHRDYVNKTMEDILNLTRTLQENASKWDKE